MFSKDYYLDGLDVAQPFVPKHRLFCCTRSSHATRLRKHLDEAQKNK